MLLVASSRAGFLGGDVEERIVEYFTRTHACMFTISTLSLLDKAYYLLTYLITRHSAPYINLQTH